MRGIVIAAGQGSRMSPLTHDLPKCLVPLGPSKKTIFEQTVRNMRNSGCTEIIVIAGHASAALEAAAKKYSDVRLVFNSNYRQNNILHSLMVAQPFFDTALLISYSDIWVESSVYRQVITGYSGSRFVIDTDWQDYYVGRDEHPEEQAELAVFSTISNNLHDLGKNILAPADKTLQCGEFTGLFKLDQNDARVFKDSFSAVDAAISKDAPFQRAKKWRDAYITDFLNHLIQLGHKFQVLQISKGWAEFDTSQDVNRIDSVARNQKLIELCDF